MRMTVVLTLCICQVQLLNTRLESRKRDLQKSDTFNDLEKLEMKMKHHEQNIFALNEFIEMKSRESNYEEFLEHVKTTVRERIACFLLLSRVSLVLT